MHRYFRNRADVRTTCSSVVLMVLVVVGAAQGAVLPVSGANHTSSLTTPHTSPPSVPQHNTTTTGTWSPTLPVFPTQPPATFNATVHVTHNATRTATTVPIPTNATSTLHPTRAASHLPTTRPSVPTTSGGTSVPSFPVTSLLTIPSTARPSIASTVRPSTPATARPSTPATAPKTIAATAPPSVPPTFAPTEVFPPLSSCPLGMALLGGGCWTLSDEFESCHETCTDRGLIYDPLTTAYVGSDRQVGSADQANQQCFDVLEQLNSAVGNSPLLDDSTGLGCLGYYAKPVGAGCWTRAGENNVFRCAAMDTDPTLRIKDNTLYPLRACSCRPTAVRPTERVPPRDMTWTDVSAHPAASHCFYAQNAIWHPYRPDKCMCAEAWNVEWDIHDTASILHGGAACGAMPLHSDAVVGTPPACVSDRCWDMEQSQCDACHRDMGFVQGPGGSCGCADDTPVPTSHGYDTFCAEAGGVAAPFCPPDGPCDHVADQVYFCESANAQCSIERDILAQSVATAQSDLDQCLDGKLQPAPDQQPQVAELCCGVAVEDKLSQLHDKLATLTSVLTQDLLLDERVWKRLQILSEVLSWQGEAISMVQNPLAV